jgi:sterol desaturase/sphingolipid hydroxylase (fatty acid hydroxylase superfamily)
VINPVRFALALGSLFVLLLVAERVVRLRPPTRPLLARLVVNGIISLLAFSAATVLVRPAALAALLWTSDTPFGLVHVVRSTTAQFMVAFLLMDLTFYWWHVANHRIAVLWRFHNVHHIDPDLDVSTAFRFHFGEVGLSAAFRAVQVVAIGPPLWMFASYELVFQASTLFHHSNLRLPIQFERLLNLVLVTPRMHGIHHSQVRNETNSNYSVVFSWWDRVHRTATLNVPQASVAIGIPAYTAPDDNRLSSTLLLPFRRQRDYWRRADGTVPSRDRVAASNGNVWLAE